MKEYLLLAAFMIPSLVVAGAAVVTVSHTDHPTAREILGSSASCAEPEEKKG
jgi:hypothetical protein